MTMRKLKAIKPHKYGTRHLTAGEEYEVPPRHAIALVAGKKARFADKPQKKEPQPAPVAEVATPESHAVGAMTTEDDPRTLDQLRLEATALGINVDGRWRAPRLRHEIEQVRGR